MTIPQPDTEQNLFHSAINALRIAGQEAIADDLDQRMENITKTPYLVIIADKDYEFESAIRAVWIFDTIEAANQYAAEWNRAERTKAFSENRDQTAFADIFRANKMNK